MARWNSGPADIICLSYTHDEDYEELIPEHLKFQMKGADQAASGDSQSEVEDAEAEYSWLHACAIDQLREGKGHVIGTKRLGYQQE